MFGPASERSELCGFLLWVGYPCPTDDKRGVDECVRDSSWCRRSPLLLTPQYSVPAYSCRRRHVGQPWRIARWVKVGAVPGLRRDGVSSLEGKNCRNRESRCETSAMVFSMTRELYCS